MIDEVVRYGFDSTYEALKQKGQKRLKAGLQGFDSTYEALKPNIVVVYNLNIF